MKKPMPTYTYGVSIYMLKPHPEAGVVRVRRYTGETRDLKEGDEWTWTGAGDAAACYFQAEPVPSSGYHVKAMYFDGYSVVPTPIGGSRWFQLLPDGEVRGIGAEFESDATYKLTVGKQGEGSITNPSESTTYYHKWDVASVRCYPATGWYFDYFLLDGKKESGFIDNIGGLPMNALDITMTANHDVVCVFGKWLSIEGYLGSGSGYVDVEVDGRTSRWSIYNVKKGQTARFTATPNAGYVFDYYLVNGAKYTDNPLTLTVNDDIRYEAYFKPGAPPVEKVRVTIGCGPNGTTSPIPGTYEYDKGSTVVVWGIPSSGYTLDYWAVDGSTYTSNPLQVVVSKDTTITAYFKAVSPPPVQKVTLTIATTAGGTTNPPPGAYEYDYNSGATVLAIPDTGYVFSHWTLDGTVRGENPISIRMDRNYTLTAFFAAGPPPPPPAKVKLTIQTTTGGTTVPSPGAYEYDKGSTATVTAIPSSGYNFDYWLLNGTTYAQNPITVTMTGDATLTAYFKTLAPPPVGKARITVVATEGGTTNPAPGVYEYDKGSSATITAVPSSGYVFDYWMLDGSAQTMNPITLTVDRDITIVAYFRKTGAPPTPPAKMAFPAFLVPIVLGTGVTLASEKAKRR